MKKNMLIQYGFLALLLAAGMGPVAAQTSKPIDMVTTAVPFLRVNPDARSGGMGELGIATTPDACSGLFNGAKLPFTAQRSGVALNYTPWLRDIAPGMYMLQAGAYHRIDTFQAISASVRYFSLGDVLVEDHNGVLLQTARPNEYSLDLGYSRKLSGKLALALALRYIRSNLASGNVNGTDYKPGNALATDISLFYSGLNGEGQGLTAGAALTNLGSKISYTTDASDKYYLPTNLGVGIAYTGVFDEQNRLLIGADGNRLMVPGPGAYAFSLGTEYSYDELLFLRAGYFIADKNRGGLNYLTAGVGIKYSVFRVNLSYLVPSGNGVSRNPLSNTFRFGLLIN